MSRLCPRCVAVLLLNTICLTSALAAGAEAELRRVEVSQSPVYDELTCDIGEWIAAGRVQPREAIGTEVGRRGRWLLRNPQSAPALRWPRNLLNAGPEAPELVIDPQLQGTYDVVAVVRAVDGGGTAGARAATAGPLPTAFELALDDGSQREIVGAKGFPDRHFDNEVLAGCGWRMDGRQLVVRSLGKPVYLYGFRFVPCASADWPASGKAVRWLATDHVTIAQEPDKHFAFPGVALTSDGDLVVVYRDGTVHGAEPCGKVSLSRSTDGGRTWQPRVTALDRQDVGPDQRDRPPHGRRHVESQTRKVADADLGYPTSAQLADGSIFTVYYHNTAGSNCFIAGTFWRPPETKQIH